MNLYEIDAELLTLFESMIDPETGEINEDFRTQYDALEMEREKKLDSWAWYLKNLKADIAAAKDVQRQITERIRGMERRLDTSKQNLQEYLNGEKFRSATNTVSYRTTDAVELSEGFRDLDPSEYIDIIPLEYLRYKDPEINKELAKKALKDGEQIPGLQLVQKASMIVK